MSFITYLTTLLIFFCMEFNYKTFTYTEFFLFLIFFSLFFVAFKVEQMSNMFKQGIQIHKN